MSFDNEFFLMYYRAFIEMLQCLWNQIHSVIFIMGFGGLVQVSFLLSINELNGTHHCVAEKY